MAAALASIPVTDGGRDYRTAKIVAVIAGLLGALLAIATPFLPVEQTTAKLNWPQNAVLDSVTAPLISYVATDLDIEAQEILRLRGRLYDILAKHTGQSPEKIEKDCDRNLWLGAEESIEYGLADRILQKAPEIVKDREKEDDNQK